MAAAALPLMVASTAMQGLGSIYGGYQQAANYRGQARAADYNAALAEQQSQQAMQASSAEEDSARRKSAMAMGAQRAALTESGLDLASGTGADLVSQSALNSELDALNIRYAGTLKSMGLKEEANSYRNQAAQMRSNAKSAVIGGYFGAASSVLSGAGSYAMGQAKVKQANAGLTS